MAESFVKARYDYHSNETGDLSFKAGAIIKILDKVDGNWISGEHEGKIGLFPANFVEPISAVPDSVPERTVIGSETYISGEDGVLTFFQGDVITFLGFVDDYWCRGSFGGEVGLFPAFAVHGLDKSSGDVTESETSAEFKSEPQESTVTLTPEEPVRYEEPSAEALFEFQGLSRFEISFPAGAVVLLTKDINTEWFEGSYKGESGLFPKSFVKVVVPLSEDTCAETYVPHAIAVYPFVGETATELSFREGDIIFLHDWVSPEWIKGEIDGTTGIFPSSFVQIQIELPQPFPDSLNSQNEWAKRNGSQDLTVLGAPDSSFKIGDTALAIYSFATNTKGDLSLAVGDVVTIESIIDEEWVEGRKNGNEVGLCPAVFLELKEDGLKTSDVDMKERGSVCTSGSAASPQPVVSQFTDDLHTPVTSNHFINDQCLSINEIQNTNKHTCSTEEGSSPDVTQSPTKVSISVDSVATKPRAESDRPIPNDSKIVSSKTASKPSLGPKPALAPKPTISSKPKFLKKPGKPDLPQKPVGLTKTKSSHVGHLVTTGVTRSQAVTSSKQVVNHVGQSGRYVQEALSDEIKPNSVIRENNFDAKQQKPPLAIRPRSLSNNWVKFENTEESDSPVEQTVPNQGPFSAQTNLNNKSSNSPVSSANKTLEHSYDISYKSVLNKSLKDDASSRNRGLPKPPQRLDLLVNNSVDFSPTGALSDKLKEQAEEFEKSSQSRKSSPSLNELRSASQKGAPPVPVRRNKPQSRPSSYHSDTSLGQDKPESAFPVLDELDEQITKLNNQLQKETKVLSGVEVLVQMVNKDTAKIKELESKKGITERKIENLKSQLRKNQDDKKRLVKLVNGYPSQLDIKLKVEQLQEAIQENVDTKNKLISMLSENEDEETAKDLQENISFCDNAIKNIKSELDPLFDILHQLEGGYKEPRLVKEQDVNFRKKVIDEILETEKSFGCDLSLCVKHFMMQLIEWKVDKVDCDLLFGNMPEVAALSSKLLHRLQSATNNVDINDQIIGNCFVDFSDEMTTVYGRYCRNHDDAITFIEKSANNEEIQQYFKKCLESIREFSNCWDLSSFLIKPVQRILKYPLLLNELLKNTPNDHPDRPGLVNAVDVITAVANDVNEFKRRKDLVQKYQKVEDSGLSTKFQKFTWHSLVKKSTRFNQRITQFTGLVSQTVDEEFNEKERMFYHIEKTIKNFVKNAAQYMEQFEEVHANQLQTAENIINFYQEMASMKEVKEYHDAQRCIEENLLKELKRVLDEEVLLPLNNLMHLFQGPHRLIQKRHDKCLDYDRWTNKIDKIKDRDKLKQAKEELELAKKNYEALNAQLLDELPVFNSKALVFLQTCITNFAHMHKDFFVKALDLFSPSVQLSVVNPEGNEIVLDFSSQNILATHEVFQLTFTHKKQSPRLKPIRPSASPKDGRQNLSVEEKPLTTRSLKRSASDSKRIALTPTPSSDSGSGIMRSQTVSVRDRSLLKKKVEIRREVNPVLSVVDTQKSKSENSTFVVQFAFEAEAPTELSVNKDDIIRVLQFHDNFGNSEWWKVDHDGKTGYVPSSFFTPHAISGHVSKGNGTLLNSPSEYIAKYDFEAQGASEVSLAVGDVVRVVQQHDSYGNSEWWEIEVDRQHGYVPASYLAKR